MSEQSDDTTSFEIPVPLTNDPRICRHASIAGHGHVGTIIGLARFAGGLEIAYVMDPQSGVQTYNAAALLLEPLDDDE